MEGEEPRIALLAGAGQHRPRMRLVEPLVGRKARIAVAPEDAARGIAGKRNTGFGERRRYRGNQRAERRQYLGLVHRLARLEPIRVVVVAQAPEESERCRAKPRKPGSVRFLP